jgi:uncharacterized protein
MRTFAYRLAVLTVAALPLAAVHAHRPAAAPTAGDIPIDAPWKQAVYDFAATKLQHSAWGLAHSQRDYLASVDLAAREGLSVDTDVLFAAAFLHDMGGFPEFAAQGVDHAVRSAELVGGVLEGTGFPMAKLDGVKAAILTHSYYSTERPVTPEAIVLHDADTLDFLGIVGIARIVSLTERDGVASDLPHAVRTCESLLAAAPGALVTDTARTIGAARAAEMRTALDALNAESFGGRL